MKQSQVYVLVLSAAVALFGAFFFSLQSTSTTNDDVGNIPFQELTPVSDYPLRPMTPVPLADREYDIPPDAYQMVYITDRNTRYDSDLIAPDGLFVEYGSIDVAYSWDDVMAFDQQATIQALVIHESAYDLVDGEWLGDAMRNGVVVTGINLHYKDIARLTNNHCALELDNVNPFADEETDYFYISGAITRASNPDEQAKLDAALSETCTQPENLQGQVRTHGYATHSRITTEYDVAGLVEDIMGTISIIENSKQIFETVDLEPSPVPEVNP